MDLENTLKLVAGISEINAAASATTDDISRPISSSRRHSSSMPALPKNNASVNVYNDADDDNNDDDDDDDDQYERHEFLVGDVAERRFTSSSVDNQQETKLDDGGVELEPDYFFSRPYQRRQPTSYASSRFYPNHVA